ncbi:MAG: hypothetical protein E7402_01655 [Ruminococcaceae bacterium]|nr:hypothetical protein [Oscillospiraceae bacterium]
MADEQSTQQLKEEFKMVGRLLSEGLGQGITDGSKEAKAAMDQLGDELLDSQMQYFEEKARLEAAIDSAEEAKYRKEYQTRLSRAKSAAQAETVRKNEELRLYKKANEAYVDALEAHLATVEAKIKAKKTQIAEDFKDIAQRAEDSLETIEKSQQAMEKKMEDYGGLFEHKKYLFLNSGPNGTPERLERTILDLSAQRQELEKYSSLLQKVRERDDVPAELFDSISKLSIQDAIRFQEALLHLDDEKREQYFADWEAIQKLSEETAQRYFVDDTKRVLASVEQELADWYGTIPAGFFQEGNLSAEAFGQGFMNQLTSMQDMMREAINVVLSVPVEETPQTAPAERHTIQNKQYQVTYILGGAQETVAQQLQAIHSAETIKRLRG